MGLARRGEAGMPSIAKGLRIALLAIPIESEERNVPEGQAIWAPFLFVSFLWVSKEKGLALLDEN